MSTVYKGVTIPNIISGFYGMNVEGLPFANTPHSFLAVILFTASISGVITAILAKKNMF